MSCQGFAEGWAIVFVMDAVVGMAIEGTGTATPEVGRRVC
jgi:hypothetical protein